MAEAQQYYHGAALRLPMRWPNAEQPFLSLSRYVIAPGETCSLHVHSGKTETWVVVAGEGHARLGDEVFEVKEGDALVTPPGTPHELVNTGDEPLHFLNFVTFVGGPVTTTELA